MTYEVMDETPVPAGNSVFTIEPAREV